MKVLILLQITTIICKLENYYNGTHHNFKFYLKKKFRDEMERFKKNFLKNLKLKNVKQMVK